MARWKGEMSRKQTKQGFGHSDFDEPQGSVAPLIDVSFLLLIFFLVSSTLLKKEMDLTMWVPEPGVPREHQPQLPVVVEVRESGEIVLNPDFGETLVSMDSEERSLPVLYEHLAMMAAVTGGKEMVVQLRADDGATHQRVVDVLNCFASVGVTSVGLVDVL